MALTTDSSPPHHVTAAEVRAREALTAAVVDEVISIFSLQPDDSPVHNVQKHGENGLRIWVPVFNEPNGCLWVYAMPWSRGWSVFALDHALPSSDTVVGPYWWRYSPSRLKGLQHPLYVPRDQTGPWLVPAKEVANAVLDVTDKLTRLNTARIARFRRKYWYWSNTLLAAKTKEANSQHED